MKKKITGLLECIKTIFKYRKRVLILVFLLALIDNVSIYVLNSANMFAANALVERFPIDIFIKKFMRIMCTYIILKSFSETIQPIITNDFIKVGIYINFDLGKHYMKLPYYKTEDPKFIDKFDKALRAVNSRVGMNKIFQSLQLVVVSFFSVVVLGYSIQKRVHTFLIYLLIAVVVFLLNEIILRTKLYENENNMIRSIREELYYTSLYTGYEYGKEIRANRLYILFNNKIKKAVEKICKGWKKERCLTKVNILISGITYIAIYCFVLYSMIRQTLNGKMNIGEFVFSFGILSSILTAIKTLIVALMDIYETGIYFWDYSEFNEIIKREIREETSKKNLKEIKEIEFVDVSFKYPGSEVYALENISFKIKKNETVAFVGANGCGKTTIINLLLGLYRPEKGKILINGLDFEEIKRESYIDLISAIFQEDYLFAFPIWKNITMSNTKDIKQFEKVINETGTQNLLEKFREKENTVIYKKLNEKGVELSGGEGKKICCTRALYKQADLFVCDEVAASLDIDAEYQTYEIIYKYCRNKILIFVSHKIRTTLFCDKIIFLDKGKIKEMGTPQELLVARGIYYEMYKQETCSSK